MKERCMPYTNKLIKIYLQLSRKINNTLERKYEIFEKKQRNRKKLQLF